MTCAAANASLELLESKPLYRGLTEWQGEFADRWTADPRVQRVRHIGTVVAFDMRCAGTEGYHNDAGNPCQGPGGEPAVRRWYSTGRLKYVAYWDGEEKLPPQEIVITAQDSLR